MLKLLIPVEIPVVTPVVIGAVVVNVETGATDDVSKAFFPKDFLPEKR